MKNIMLQTQGGLSQCDCWLPGSHPLYCLQLRVPGPSLALLTFAIGLAFPPTHVLKWLSLHELSNQQKGKAGRCRWGSDRPRSRLPAVSLLKAPMDTTSKLLCSIIPLNELEGI